MRPNSKRRNPKRKRKKKEGRITKKMGCPADRRNFSLFLILKGNIFQKRKETRADLIDESKKIEKTFSWLGQFDPKPLGIFPGHCVVE